MAQHWNQFLNFVMKKSYSYRKCNENIQLKGGLNFNIDAAYILEEKFIIVMTPLLEYDIFTALCMDLIDFNALQIQFSRSVRPAPIIRFEKQNNGSSRSFSPALIRW